MKYLKVFETENLQNEFRAGEDYIQPHVSCLEDGSKVKYNIYTKEERIYLSQPFTIEALDTGTITGNLTDGKIVKYSKNDGEGTSGDGTTAINVVAGDEVAFVGNNSSYFAGNTSSAVVCSANFNVKGNIMSLISETDFGEEHTLTELFTFGNFFRLQPVISAENLLLPATTLTKSCYALMFFSTPLVLAPKVLPAPVLSETCYIQMFRACQSLQKCPIILATTMAKNSCNMMFAYCDSLTKTCEFPATTLAEGCYNEMFSNCINLKKVCELPATTVATKCYIGMFASCSNLTKACETLPATKLEGGCYASMFVNCQKLKTSPKIMAIDLTDATRCCDGMFAYCYSLEKAPELKPTVLYDYCYINMFRDCTSLRELPNLPATTLASCCYQQMFHGCTGITTIPQNFLPATSLAYRCYTSMFLGCTGLTSIPSNLLPATTLTDGCYGTMFMDCTGLTTSPELPASTLVDTCYQMMFQNCTNLNHVTCLATNISATNCVDSGLDGVAETGTFEKASGMSNGTTGASGIPSGWTVETASS